MTRLRHISILLAVVSQGLALWLLLTTRSEWLALVLHTAGALAWGWGTAIFLSTPQQRAWWLPAVAALVFPVGGLLASLALIRQLRTLPPANAAPRYIVWRKQQQVDWTPSLPAGARGTSIVEILQGPNTQLRRNATLALRDLDPLFAIPLLRKGLQDSDEQVRIYAQNILSAMLERFEATVKALEQRRAADPGAVAPAVNLAEQYFELVYLGVAGDDETAAHYLKLASALLENAATLAPTDGHIAFLGLKYALHARDTAAAHRWLQRVDQCKVEPQQVLPWRMELDFLEGNWDRLKAQLAASVQAGYINPRIEALASFWLQPAAPTP